MLRPRCRNMPLALADWAPRRPSSFSFRWGNGRAAFSIRVLSHFSTRARAFFFFCIFSVKLPAAVPFLFLKACEPVHRYPFEKKKKVAEFLQTVCRKSVESNRKYEAVYESWALRVPSGAAKVTPQKQFGYRYMG